MIRIGIDLDGTVTNYLKSAIPFVEEMYGRKPDFSKPVYGIEGVFGWTRENRPSDIKERLYLEKRIFRHLHRLEEDNNLLTSSLVREIPDLKIYFVTARSPHPTIVEDTLHWVTNNTDHFNDVFHVVQTPKADFCTTAGIPVLIEDEIHQIVHAVEKGVNVICMTQPWNKDVENTIRNDAPGKIIRVNDWREAVSAAKEFLL